MNPTILVYVAGPFSARKRSGVERNIERAVAVGIKVAKLGFTPVIPHANTAHPEFERVQSYPFWIEGTTEMMRRCDAVVMVPDEMFDVILIDHDRLSYPGWYSAALTGAVDDGAATVWCVPTENGSVIVRGQCASWRDSSGALRERAEAARLGIPVFDTVEELGEWNAQGRAYDERKR